MGPPPPPPRPKAVAVLGGVFLVAALLACASSIAELVSLPARKQELFAIAADPRLPRVVRLLADYAELVGLVKCGVALLVGLTAIQFLRLRRRARDILEAVTWLGFGYLSVATAWLWTLLDRSRLAQVCCTTLTPDRQELAKALALLLVWLLGAVPLVLLLRALRNERVRSSLR